MAAQGAQIGEEMKVQFVDNFTINLGVSGISSVLKKRGFDVGLSLYQFSIWSGIDLYCNPTRYFDFHKIACEILKQRPDVVAFSVFSANYQFFKAATAAIRKISSVPIVVGGVFPSLIPELFINDSLCDVVFRGEAEAIAPQLFEQIAKREFANLPNVIYRSPSGSITCNAWTSYLEDLDGLPFPDHFLYPKDPHYLHTITSRGCPLSCAYCSSGVFTRMSTIDGAGRIRYRAIDKIIEEIKHVQSVDPRKNIYFWDDFFVTSIARMSDFMKVYKREIGVPFLCIAFPTTITEEMAKLLADSGCQSIGMGFQTANDDYKLSVLKRKDRKESVAKAISFLRKRKIKYSLDHIFNLPGETKQHIGESLNFYLENRVPYLQVNFLNYYPDSEITQYAHKNGFMNDEQYEKVLRNSILGDQTYKGTILNERLSNEQVQFAVLFKLIDLLPSKVIRSIFRWNIYKIFPTNRKVYYGISFIAFIKVYGFDQIMRVINMFFPVLKEFVQTVYVFFFREKKDVDSD